MYTLFWELSYKVRVTYLRGPEESRNACLTVDASCVVTAANTDSAPSFLTMDVQAEWQVCYRLIKVALLRLAVAVTLWKHTQTMLELYFLGLLIPAGGGVCVGGLIHSLPPHESLEKHHNPTFKTVPKAFTNWLWSKSGSSTSLSLPSQFPTSKVYN